MAPLPKAGRRKTPSEPETGADFEDGGDDREGDEGDEREGGDEDGGGDRLRDRAEPAVELGAVGAGDIAENAEWYAHPRGQ